MIIYIDETENEQYFILAGLLVPNKEFVEIAYKHFKNKINRYSINPRAKEKIYREFKSIVLDRHYQRIKNAMLDEIDNINNHFVIYCAKYKKDIHLTQERKEEIYLNLITNIVKQCKNVSVVYDSFNNLKFERKINNELSRMNNVDIVVAKDSQEEHGLQFADNLCSVIRLHLSKNDKYNYYGKIASKVIKV